MKSVSSTLTALNRKAEGAPKHRFRDLYRLLNLQALYESFGSLKKNAAPGVDGVTWEGYEANLDGNLQGLLERLKAKRYRAPHVKRCYIPKGGGKLRPLGLPTLEDKIVQHAASRILESIYEADFSDRSLGYRRGKPGAREISQQLSQELKDGTYRWIVEADIKSFFDEVDHDWLEEMLKQRIDDRAFVGLIRKWLKAGVMELKSKEAEMPENGTPQGGIVSPILANIYRFQRMKTRFKLTRYPYEDLYHVQLLLEAANGSQHASIEYYANAQDLIELGAALIQFPFTDSREHIYEIGSEDPAARFAYYIRLRFFLIRPNGACGIEVRFNNNGQEAPYRETAEFTIQAEVAGINRLRVLLKSYGRLEHRVLEWDGIEGQLLQPE